MSNLYRGPSNDAFYQLSVHLAKWLQRRRFLEINQSETRIVCGGHVCNRIGTKLAILIEDLPRMLPTKFRFIWPSGFREDFFRNQPIRNKNCLWWPCLLTDRHEMSNLYRGHAIDASYQVSVHLAKWFQRRRFLEICQSETRIDYGSHIC
jgi:hypothetical protein